MLKILNHSFTYQGGDNWIKGREDVWLKFHLMDKLAKRQL